MKIDGEYQLIDDKGNPSGDSSKEPIQNPTAGLKIRFTSEQFLGDQFESTIPETRVWGNIKNGAEAVVTTISKWNKERQMDLCLYSFTVTGSNPRVVETLIEIVKSRLGVSEKPQRLPPLI